MRNFDAEMMPELIQKAAQAAVSFRLDFWEAEECLSFEIVSAAKGECGYIKRAYSIKECIQFLEKKCFGQ